MNNLTRRYKVVKIFTEGSTRTGEGTITSLIIFLKSSVTL